MREIGAGAGCMLVMSMDPFTLLYYAIICACLGFFAPKLGKGSVRFLVGALVGIAGAALLPMVRGMI